MKRNALLSILFFTSISLFGQGPEMLNNGSFSNTSYWGISGNYSISTGNATYNGSSISMLYQTNLNMQVPVEPNTTYTIEFDIKILTGRPYIKLLSADLKSYSENIVQNNDHNSFEFTTPADVGSKGLYLYTYPDGTFTIDNISLVKNSPIGDDPYYVHPNGSDAASGDINHPWKTWQKAFDVARPGDTVFFRGGVYYPYNPPSIDAYFGKQRSGTEKEWICYMAFPGEEPILDLSLIVRTSQWTGLSINWATYIHFKGLTVRNAYQRYAGTITLSGWGMTGTSNIIVENCKVHNIGGRGFAYYGYFGEHNIENPQVPDVPYDTTRFINCDVYMCQDSLNNGGEGGSAVGGFGDGYKGSTHLGGYLSYEGCRAWDCSDDGFDPNWQGFINIENCWSFRNGRWQGDGYGYKIATWEKVNVEVTEVPGLLRNFTNNIAAFNSQGPGLGITYGSARPMCNGNWSNNTFYKNKYGIDVSHEYLATNTVYSMIFRNNVVYNNQTNFICSGPPYIAENNNFSSSFPYGYTIPTNDDDFVHVDQQLAIAELTAPRKTDGSLPDITFLKLKSTSDLIDAGKDIGIPYYGKAPDLGYAEYIEGSATLPAPVVLMALIENATPSKLEINYNLSLANIVPAASTFSVRVNSVSRTVSSVAVSGTKVTLILASPVVYGDAVTVAYTKPATNPLQTSAGGQVASFTDQNVTNKVAAIPVYANSVIENASPSILTITYNMSLANIVPAPSAFSVRVNSTARTISSVAVSGTRITLTLSSPVVYGDAVTVAYTKPSINPLQTLAGGQAGSFTDIHVSNNCVAPVSNQAPIVSISSPTKSTAFVAPATITIDAVASDPDGIVSKVEFYNTNIKLGESIASPYSFTWKEVPEGTYSITAVATDNLNLKTTSAVVTVVVQKSSTGINQMPEVSIITPAKNKKYKKNEKILIEATATDMDGTINKVEIKSGNITLAELFYPPYFYQWEPLDTGIYNIYAVATDNVGAKSISSIIELHILDFIDKNSESIILYPNPNNGQFTVDLSSSELNESYRLDIVDFTGKLVYTYRISDFDTSKQIDMSAKASGSYILILREMNTIRATKSFIMK